MAYPLGDIYIGNYDIGQNFGVRPDLYQARFGVRGHNGIDIFCPSLTMVLAAQEGVVLETGFSEAGYGNFVKLLHSGYLTVYAHLNDITVKKGDKVVTGQLIAHSGNTGLSDTTHLHFGIAPCDGTGARTQIDNGFGGYIDPMSSLCLWSVKGLREPNIMQIEEVPLVPVNAEELQTKRIQATNFESVYNYIKQFDKEEVLGGVETHDPEAGQKVNIIINGFVKNLQAHSAEGESKEETPKSQKRPWLQSVKGFIIKQNT